jgi:hypothetical protein
MDATESVRRDMVQAINSDPSERERLEAIYGEVFDTAALQERFTVLGFMAPFVVVRTADGIRGSLTFQHSPRFYYDFQPE